MLLVSSLHKNETMFQAQLPSISSLCKNETDPLPLSRVFTLVLELEPSFHLPSSRSSYPLVNIFTLVTRFFRLGMEEESSDEMKVGGHVKPLATMLGVGFTRSHAGGKIPTSVYHVNGIFQTQFTHWFRVCIKMKPMLEHFFN